MGSSAACVQRVVGMSKNRRKPKKKLAQCRDCKAIEETTRYLYRRTGFPARCQKCGGMLDPVKRGKVPKPSFKKAPKKKRRPATEPAKSDEQRIRVTRELIETGRTGSGGWNKRQLKILGVKWPPRKGWLSRSIGKLITPEDAKLFVELKGATTEKWKRKKQQIDEKRERNARSQECEFTEENAHRPVDDLESRLDLVLELDQ